LFEPPITLRAFAKINLSLRVIGKRPDGYHEIRTVFQTIGLHDSLSFAAIDTPHIILSCDDRRVPPGAENIVCRAASALQQRFGSSRGAYIRLEKKIPTEAGLGGGSSDAAATLVALSHLWRTNATEDDLREVAVGLGADVPFFLRGGAALGTGIGTELAELADGTDKFLLVLKPNAGISTAAAYRALNARSLTSAEAKTILSSSQGNEFFDNLDSEVLQNDFEAAIFGLEPEIKRAKAALIKAGARAALLAGSGSAVFGVFDNSDAQECAIQVIELEAGWRVFPCKTIGRSLYQSAMGAAGEILTRSIGSDVTGR
jgi:4-diphosphocytidyl-2-C-methyl-D-erythritol kinase